MFPKDIALRIAEKPLKRGSVNGGPTGLVTSGQGDCRPGERLGHTGPLYSQPLCAFE